MPKPKRAITFEEHQQIVLAEINSERRAYYSLRWEIGALQTDGANPTAGQLIGRMEYFPATGRKQANIAGWHYGKAVFLLHDLVYSQQSLLACRYGYGLKPASNMQFLTDAFYIPADGFNGNS